MNNISELFTIKDLYVLYQANQLLVMIGIMVIAFYPLLLVTKKIISPSMNKIAKLKNKNYEDILKNHELTTKLAHVFSSLYLMFWGDVFNKILIMSSAILRIKDTIINVYIIFAISSLVLCLIDIWTEAYKTKHISRVSQAGLHTQIIKIIVIICAILTIVSTILGISISALFTSIGAAAALLTFVFKDTVLGLMAGLQLTFQDIVRVGDWVTIPNYNADGDVEKITITVVVVRNFDQTYTIIPTYAFLTSGVKNWRTMFQSGGRRIKRAINIDINTVSICSQEQLDKFSKISYIGELTKTQPHLFDAKNSVANITIFRKYVEEYLRANENIHKEDFTFLVRQLDPTDKGMPIELYIFTKDTNWVNYESIQADIFDHLLGIISEFELKVFQSASTNKQS
jgi:miniconductance mechanosensitive channel